MPKSDDASHDEALSSRVAALNMLDLGLEHLGVDVGAAGAGVEAVLKTCGDSTHLELWVGDPGLSTFTRQHFLVSRTQKFGAQRTKLLYWSRYIRPLLVRAVPCSSNITAEVDSRWSLTFAPNPA